MIITYCAKLNYSCYISEASLVLAPISVCQYFALNH